MAKIVWKVIDAPQTSAALRKLIQQEWDAGWDLFQILPGDGREPDKLILNKTETEDSTT